MFLLFQLLVNFRELSRSFSSFCFLLKNQLKRIQKEIKVGARGKEVSKRLKVFSLFRMSCSVGLHILLLLVVNIFFVEIFRPKRNKIENSILAQRAVKENHYQLNGSRLHDIPIF
jgi:hypothetical protein